MGTGDGSGDRGLVFWRERCHALEEELRYLKRSLSFSRNEQIRQENLSAARDKMLKRLNSAYQTLIQEKNDLAGKLRYSYHRLQAIVDNSPFPIFSLSFTGELRFANPAFHGFFEHAMHDNPIRTLDQFLPEDAVPLFRGRMLESIYSGRPVTFEMSLYARGVWATLETTLFPVQGFEEEHLVLCGICNDLTERRRILAENMRSGQLASLGEIAASVAHEINNPINGIINYAQMLLDGDANDSLEILAKIQRESSRIASITRSMLNYAKGNNQCRECCSLEEIVENALELTRLAILKSGVELNVDIAPSLPLVTVSPGEIQQVLINLLTNARKAVLAEEKVNKRINIKVYPHDAARLLRVMVEDNGIGISKLLQSKIFEPFYSTFDQGTGLGLAISRRIMESYSGSLSVDSSPGECTRFYMDLPVESPSLTT